jgi:hypothetical protein
VLGTDEDRLRAPGNAVQHLADALYLIGAYPVTPETHAIYMRLERMSRG